jgi:cysteinyl-tRNA synthetase
MPALPAALQPFSDSLDEDLNISAGWGAVFEWIRELNRRMAESSLSTTDAAAALAAWNKIDSVLGIGTPADAEAPAEIVALLAARQAARQAKDFKKSDAIRDGLKAKGWTIEDTTQGSKLKKI